MSYRADIKDDVVVDMYVNQGMTIRKIAKSVHVMVKKVSAILHYNNVDINNPHSMVYWQLYDKDWLESHYWGEEELSGVEIAKSIGCSERHVYKALRRYGIKVRTHSEAISGDKHYQYGTTLSDAKKEELSLKMQKNWKDPEYRKEQIAKSQSKTAREKRAIKARENRKHQVFPTHHTKPEMMFLGICKKHNLPFKYVGDSTFWIENINPDFVECTGRKIAIEIFGDYWHSPLLRPTLRDTMRYDVRRKILKKCGWTPVIFWESDITRPDAEKFVLSTLKGVI